MSAIPRVACRRGRILWSHDRILGTYSLYFQPFYQTSGCGFRLATRSDLCCVWMRCHYHRRLLTVDWQASRRGWTKAHYPSMPCGFWACICIPLPSHFELTPVLPDVRPAWAFGEWNHATGVFASCFNMVHCAPRPGSFAGLRGRWWRGHDAATPCLVAPAQRWLAHGVRGAWSACSRRWDTAGIHACQRVAERTASTERIEPARNDQVVHFHQAVSASGDGNLLILRQF